MSSPPQTEELRVERRDYYAVLGAEPSASASELRAAFRGAVLRHHPDRSPDSHLATRRTSVLNRAWSELRDPLRRVHYDRALERGTASTLPWPLELDEAPGAQPRRGTAGARPRPGAGERPSRWHMPQWRSVEGFRVPVEVFLAGPAAQRSWIVANRIIGEDWRDHTERYWLRYAAAHYRERGHQDDWLGVLERLVEVDQTYDTLVQARLREAYLATGQELRGIGALRAIAEQYGRGSHQRRWVDRELRALLGAFRDEHVRRGRPDERAEAAELLLNYLEALDMEPGFADVRAAIQAHRRAGNSARASELVKRAVDAPVTEPARWFSLVQLLTEDGQLERASAMLAAIARGDHPAALDRRRIGGDPARRISAARRRLERAHARQRSGPRAPR